jgi:hypothetical protein
LVAGPCYIVHFLDIAAHDFPIKSGVFEFYFSLCDAGEEISNKRGTCELNASKHISLDNFPKWRAISAYKINI